MESKLTAVLLTSVVLLSTLGVAGAGALQSQSAGNQSATVSVSATGTVTAEPDQAVVHVAVTAEGENASDATEDLASNVSDLRAALDDENLSVTSVRTTDYSVSQEQPGEGQGQGNAPTTYVARQSFAVTTSDTSEAGAVIDAAVANGATEVGGVTFTLSEDRRQDLRTDAIDEAVDDARVQAEAVADSTGLSLGSVDSVSTGDHVGFVGDRVGAEEGTTIDASPVTVSASVTITYNATAD
ncbi:SIMPL domain-containing protein [Halosimplex salinum]|uniref:SIMPL domain-containing protein n=1 Tax=Halosimplex salinum TaxID=1710538 RepID=UPI000F4A49F3|nr:SIMPL domain-containing protein [Halosimplex salinum]